MKSSFALFAACDILLLSLTAILGLTVNGTQGFARHFLLGVMASLFTCFVHVVAFVYFIVQDKVIKQSVMHYGLDAAYAQEVDLLKLRVLKLSMIGIATIIVTSGLGAAVGIAVPATAHLIAGFAAIPINAILFVLQYAVVEEYGRMFVRAFEANEGPPQGRSESIAKKNEDVT